MALSSPGVPALGKSLRCYIFCKGSQPQHWLRHKETSERVGGKGAKRLVYFDATFVESCAAFHLGLNFHELFCNLGLACFEQTPALEGSMHFFLLAVRRRAWAPGVFCYRGGTSKRLDSTQTAASPVS